MYKVNRINRIGNRFSSPLPSILFHRGYWEIRWSHGGKPIFKYPFFKFSFLERIVARGSIISQRNGKRCLAESRQTNLKWMHERMNTPFLSFPEEFDVSTKTGNDFGAFGVKKMRIQRKNSFSPSSFSFSLFSLFLSPGGKIFEVGRMGRRDGGRWLGQVKKDPALSQSGRLLRFLSMQRVIWPVAVAGQARPGQASTRRLRYTTAEEQKLFLLY